MGDGREQDRAGRSARCPMCGHPLEMVWVHGHGQCAACGMNIDACCQGAPMPLADGDSERDGDRRGTDDRRAGPEETEGAG